MNKHGCWRVELSPLALRVAGNLACRRAFRPPSRLWPFAPMNHCCGRGADTRVCSAETHLGAALWDTLQLVQSSAARPAGYSSGFVSSGIEKTKPEKFAAHRDGGLKGRLQAGLPATQTGNKSAEMSLGAADTSGYATSDCRRAEARHLRAPLASLGQAKACPTARQSRKPSAVSGQRSTNRLTFRRYVGQVGNLRRVGNPPLSGTGQFIGRPIANRPQDAILPYKAGLEAQRAGCTKSSRRAKNMRDSDTKQDEERRQMMACLRSQKSECLTES